MSKYGSELVLVGDFASDTIWTKDADWSIAAGIAVWLYAGSNGNIKQTIAGLVLNTVYRVEYEVTALSIATGTTIKALLGGTSGTARNTVGIHTENIVMGAVDSDLSFEITGGASSSTISIDNVSVRKVQTVTLTSLDTKAQDIAYRLINDYGLTASFHITDDEFNAATGKNIHDYPSIVSVKVSPPIVYNTNIVDGEIIKRGDTEIMLASKSLSFTPINGMRVEINGDDWTIVAVEPAYSGEQIALYKLQMRI